MEWRGENVLREESTPGQRVAVLSMVGTFCPVTLGHIEAFVQGREILLGRANTAEGVPIDEPFDLVLGCVGLNSQNHAERKLREKNELPLEGARAGISLEDRGTLMALATQDLPWLNLCSRPTWDKKFPELTFVYYSLNGADDVAKYRKWHNCSKTHRYLTLGRPGFTETVREGMAKSRVDPRWCILAPELPDISSTAARAALRKKEMAHLHGLLDGRVVDWCIENRAYGYTGGDGGSGDGGGGVDDVLSPWLIVDTQQLVCRQPSSATTTMLRSKKTDARTDDVWVASRKCVADGDVMEVLETDGTWAQVRAADDGTVGLIKCQHLHDVVPAERTVRRTDLVSTTMLRRIKTNARTQDAWLDSRTKVHNLDTVLLLNVEDEWAKVGTRDGAIGYLKLVYLV